MVSLAALSPAPLAEVRQGSRAALLAALGLRIVLAVAIFGGLAGLVASALWQPGAPADAVPVGDVCSDPPCLPEGLPGVRDLPVIVAPLGYLLAGGIARRVGSAVFPAASPRPCPASARTDDSASARLRDPPGAKRDRVGQPATYEPSSRPMNKG